MKKFTTKELVVLGVMIALTIIMDYTPIGVIPLLAISATIVHLPTVVTGMVLGPVAGGIVGCVMGITSLVHSATRPPSVLAPLLINPLVSVLPRIFIGIVAYYVFAFFKKIFKNKKKTGRIISTFLGAAAGSLTNTVLVLSMLYIIYANRIEEIFNQVPNLAGTTAKGFVIAAASSNGVIEAIVVSLLAVPIVYSYKVIENKSIR